MKLLLFTWRSASGRLTAWAHICRSLCIIERLWKWNFLSKKRWTKARGHDEHSSWTMKQVRTSSTSSLAGEWEWRWQTEIVRNGSKWIEMLSVECSNSSKSFSEFISDSLFQMPSPKWLNKASNLVESGRTMEAFLSLRRDQKANNDHCNLLKCISEPQRWRLFQLIPRESFEGTAQNVLRMYQTRLRYEKASTRGIFEREYVY